VAGDSATTAMVVLRVALGGVLMVHGANKVWGKGGLAGTTRYFAGLGLHPAWLHARVAAATELGAGALLAAGLVLPLASAGYVGLMLVAALTDHRGKGFFVFAGGWEYVAVLAVTAVCITALGPGRISADYVLGWNLDGVGWAAVALALGIAGAVALLTITRRPSTGVA
jgi:putative oxidoreductase